MEKNAAQARPCSDCEGLKNGTRSSRDPHQYLVLTGRSLIETYRCLVCGSILNLERRGNAILWS